MPDLTGMTLAEATSLVNASGLKTASITTAPAATIAPSDNSAFHPITPAVTVIGQTPAPGTRVTPDTTVSLEVTRSL
jgi:beta-lactam-binding protein with PASTA domain